MADYQEKSLTFRPRLLFRCSLAYLAFALFEELPALNGVESSRFDYSVISVDIDSDV